MYSALLKNQKDDLSNRQEHTNYGAFYYRHMGRVKPSHPWQQHSTWFVKMFPSHTPTPPRPLKQILYDFYDSLSIGMSIFLQKVLIIAVTLLQFWQNMNTCLWNA